ncbi:Transcriptional regulator, TetR family protein [Minicystis rosea]|nr:Transcriptional regulator, TetR family protein [Minicystis rosea]
MATKKRGGLGAPGREVELLWTPKARPSRGPKPALSIERIARAAIDVADAEGLAAVSMERVATSFGVTTMALYRYVPGKSELVALMAEVAIGAPPALDAVAGGWRPRLEAWARQLWMRFVRHPWTLEATGRLRLMGPNELGWLDAALGALAETGLGGRELLDAVLTVNGQVRIAAQFSIGATRGRRTLRGDQWGAATAALLRDHPDRFPNLTAILASDAFGVQPRDPLAPGLRCVLDGVAALVAERAPRKRRGAR